jgi:hypothetical protein
MLRYANICMLSSDEDQGKSCEHKFTVPMS